MKILTTFPQTTILPMTPETTEFSTMKKTTILTSLSTTQETIFNILPEKTILNSIPEIDIIFYLIGFDNFKNSKIDKKARFNTYFTIRGRTIPKIIVIYLEL